MTIKLEDEQGLEWTYIRDFWGHMIDESSDPVVLPYYHTYEYYGLPHGPFTDTYQRLQTTQHPSSLAESFEWYPLGVLHKRTLAPAAAGGDFSYVTEYLYDDARFKGLPTAKIQPDLGRWEYAYNDQGDVTSITDPEGNLQSISYDYYNDDANRPGRLMRVTLRDRNGYLTKWEYSDDGDLVEKKVFTDLFDNEWIKTEYLCDAMGRRTQEKVHRGDGTFAVTNYEYDPMGRLTTTVVNPVQQVTNPSEQNLTTTNEYDGQGQLVAVTNPRSTKTAYTYDPLGRTTSVTEDAGTGSGQLNLTTTYGWGVTLGWNLTGGTKNTLRVTEPGNRVTEYAFDAKRQPLEIVDAEGYHTQFFRNNTGQVTQLKRQRTPSSYETVYTAVYDVLGRIKQRAFPIDLTTYFEYNHPSNTGGCGCGGFGSFTPYKVYDTRNSGVTPNVTYNKLDLLGRLHQVVRKVGGDSGGATPDVGDAVTTYHYDGEGNLTGIDGPEGEHTTIAYDGAGRRISRTVDTVLGEPALALVTQYAYDGADNLKSVTLPHGHIVEYEYDPADRLQRVLDGMGTITQYAHDKNGNVVSRTNGELATWEYDYDVLDRLQEARDPIVESGEDGDRVTQYAYDDVGNLTDSTSYYSVGNLKNIRTHYEYDDLDRLTKVVEDYDGGEASCSSSSQQSGTGGGGGHEIIEIEDPPTSQPTSQPTTQPNTGESNVPIATTNTVTTYEYDGRSLRAILDGNCNETTYDYDSAGRLNRITYPDNLNKHIDFTHTPGQRKITRYDRRSWPTVYTFDELDRLSKRNYSGGSAAPRQEDFGYDRSGRLTSAESKIGTSPTLQTSWLRSYDLAGRPTSETQQFYDGNGSLSGDYLTTMVYALDPDTHTLTREMCYPSCGDRMVQHVWDGRGRLIDAGVAGEQIGVHWSYDTADRRMMAARRHQGANLSLYGYDDNDRLTTLSHLAWQAPGTTGYEVGLAEEYGYDPQGNRLWTQRFITPGNPQAATDRSESYEHDRRNRLRVMNRGTLTFDNGSATVEAPNFLDHETLKQKEDWVNLDRRGNWLDYRDAVEGNERRETRVPNVVNAYTSIDPEEPNPEDPNPPTTVSPKTPSYDFNGNLVFDPLARVAGQAPDILPSAGMGPGQEFAYDFENRVTTILRDTNDQPGLNNPNQPEQSPIMEFVYDALGRRVQTTEYIDAATGANLNGASGNAQPRKTRHVYVGLETIQEHSCGADGTSQNIPGEWPCQTSMPLVREFVWGDPERFPEPVAMIKYNPDTQDSWAYHYLHDVLGSVIGLVAPDGDFVERYTYDPYGKVFIETWNENANENEGAWEATFEANSGLPYSAYGNPWMWTGQRYDAAVGLYAYLYRIYLPGYGRFGQRDPLEYVDGVNLYEYARSNPVRFLDALGLDCCQFSEKSSPDDFSPNTCNTDMPEKRRDDCHALGGSYSQCDCVKNSQGCPLEAPGGGTGDGWCTEKVHNPYHQWPGGDAQSLYRGLGKNRHKQCAYNESGCLIGNDQSGAGSWDRHPPSTSEDASGDCNSDGALINHFIYEMVPPIGWGIDTINSVLGTGPSDNDDPCYCDVCVP